MKKLSFGLALIVILSVMLCSCGNSGNTGGLYWIPVILLIGFAISFVKLLMSHNSGSEYLVNSPGDPMDGKWVTLDKKIWSKGLVFFSVVFFLCAVGSYFWIRSDYRPAKPSDQKNWEKQKAKGYAQTGTVYYMDHC